MTRAIDCLVNVDFGDREMPDWMIRVKEDYFRQRLPFTSPRSTSSSRSMDAQASRRPSS